MRKTFLAICTLVLVSILTSSAYATTYSDNFDDGNADGWFLGNSSSYPYNPGNWRVEDGALVQDTGNDHVIALYEGVEPTTQEIQATFSNFNDSGYGGVVLWYKDNDNYVRVLMYKGVDGLWINEKIDGNYEDIFYTYPYPFEPWYTPNTLKVIANDSGNLAIWIDGNFARDHQVQTTERVGRSGAFNGNSGGTIDNFILITDEEEEDEDSDSDGVIDTADMCLNTTADTLKKKLGKDRWQVLAEPELGWYKGKLDKKGRVKPVYKDGLSYTYGCSGTQILDMLSVGDKKKFEDQYKHGLKTKTINEFRDKYANSVETVQVTSLNDTPTVSNTILENGKSYTIEVQGTYTFSSGERIADAEFSFNPNTNQWYEELQGVPNQQFILDLLVNGTPVDWLGSTDGSNFSAHTYSPDHKYKLNIVGQGQPISFTINDSSYDGNEGYLTVTIK